MKNPLVTLIANLLRRYLGWQKRYLLREKEWRITLGCKIHDFERRFGERVNLVERSKLFRPYTSRLGPGAFGSLKDGEIILRVNTRRRTIAEKLFFDRTYMFLGSIEKSDTRNIIHGWYRSASLRRDYIVFFVNVWIAIPVLSVPVSIIAAVDEHLRTPDEISLILAIGIALAFVLVGIAFSAIGLLFIKLFVRLMSKSVTYMNQAASAEAYNILFECANARDIET